jgi:hypothetical protein
MLGSDACVSLGFTPQGYLRFYPPNERRISVNLMTVSSRIEEIERLSRVVPPIAVLAATRLMSYRSPISSMVCLDERTFRPLRAPEVS